MAGNTRSRERGKRNGVKGRIHRGREAGAAAGNNVQSGTRWSESRGRWTHRERTNEQRASQYPRPSVRRRRRRRRHHPKHPHGPLVAGARPHGRPHDDPCVLPRFLAFWRFAAEDPSPAGPVGESSPVRVPGGAFRFNGADAIEGVVDAPGVGALAGVVACALGVETEPDACGVFACFVLSA